MHRTTGLCRNEIIDLCSRIADSTSPSDRTWPPTLGLFSAVAVTLIYLRHNRIQEELAETYGVSQSTISRAITALTPLLAKVLRRHVPTVEDLETTAQYVVDGTLLSCWSWTENPELYSGKHKTTGLNVQVACSQEGRLRWVSDPIAGNRHDTHCLRESGVLTGHDTRNWIGDKGYIGNNMITPIRKPADRDLLDWEKQLNTGVNKVRYIVERAIANLKTWRILHTDYRRPLNTFPTTISAVLGLYFYLAGE